MIKFADRVKETSTTTGTGAVDLEGAEAGFRSFSSAFATGDLVGYCIEDGTNWEVGEGTLTTGTPWTLTRSVVLSSSNAGALVNFPAGIKVVFCTSSANDVGPLTTVKDIYIDPTGDDDTGLGTLASPWATLGKAFSEALKRPIALTGQVNINCAAGEYSAADDIALSGSDLARVHVITQNATPLEAASVHRVPTAWAASTAYVLGDCVYSSALSNGSGVVRYYSCSQAGTSGVSQPALITGESAGSTADGTAEWVGLDAYTCDVVFSFAAGNVAAEQAGQYLFVEGSIADVHISGGYEVVQVDLPNNRLRLRVPSYKISHPVVGALTDAAGCDVYVIPTRFTSTNLALRQTSLGHLGDCVLYDVRLSGSNILSYVNVQIFLGQTTVTNGSNLDLWTICNGPTTISLGSYGFISYAANSLDIYSASAYLTVAGSRGYLATELRLFNGHVYSYIAHFPASVAEVAERSYLNVSAAVKDSPAAPFSISGGSYVNVSSATVTNTPTLSNLTNDTLSADGSFIKTVV